jgi:hypothetical protein
MAQYGVQRLIQVQFGDARCIQESYCYRRITQGSRSPVHLNAFVTISPEMVTNSKVSLLRRAHLCLQMIGGHFEHLL